MFINRSVLKFARETRDWLSPTILSVTSLIGPQGTGWYRQPFRMDPFPRRIAQRIVPWKRQTQLQGRKPKNMICGRKKSPKQQKSPKSGQKEKARINHKEVPAWMGCNLME